MGGRENATHPTVFFPLLSDNKAAAMVVYPSHYPHMIIAAAESFSLDDFGLSAGEVQSESAAAVRLMASEAGAKAPRPETALNQSEPSH